METLVNIKSYSYCCILYEDSTDYDFNSVLNHIKNLPNCKYCYILHQPEEEDKKHHYHIVLKFSSRRYLSSICKIIGLPINYIQPCKLNNYLKYILHIDYEDKIQYQLEDVKGTLVPYMRKLLMTDDKERVILDDILDLIDNTQNKISFSDVFSYVRFNEYLSTYLKYYKVIERIITEHNEMYYLR